MALWLDAADTATITSASGAVSQWADKSGNGKHLSQSTAGAKPTTGAETLDGKNVIAFDGSDYLVAATAADWTFLHSAQSSVFVTFRAGAVTDPEAIYALVGTSGTVNVPGGAYLAHDTRSSVPRDNALVHVAGGSGPRSVNAGPLMLSGNVWGVASVLSDQSLATAADRSELRIAAGSAVKNNASTDALNTGSPRHALAVGALMNSSNAWSLFLVGAIAEIIIYNRVVSAVERLKNEAYLSQKWKIPIT